MVNLKKGALMSMIPTNLHMEQNALLIRRSIYDKNAINEENMLLYFLFYIFYFFLGDAYPITAHAILFPACPVVKLSGCPPCPQSSSSA